MAARIGELPIHAKCITRQQLREVPADVLTVEQSEMQ